MLQGKYSKFSSYMTEHDFSVAVDTLNCCYVTEPHPELVKPYFKPGACPFHENDYGNNYWSLDYALAVDGAKWLDEKIALDFVENIGAAMQPDGRIKLYSADVFSPVHGVFTEKIGSLPKFLSTLYDIASATSRRDIKEIVFSLMTRNLAWWFQNRRDAETGLISAVFEETFVPNTKSGSMVYCPMDTNIEIYLGLLHASELAQQLGKTEESLSLKEKAAALLHAISDYLWDEEDGVYYPYVLPQKKRYKIRASSLFLGLYCGHKERQERLIQVLTDDREFHFSTFPLPTVSALDILYTEATGDYGGNSSWLGDVWTLTNYAVLRALKDNGYPELSKKLAEKTLAVFQGKYAEFAHPITCEKYGMQKYAWTAAQCLRIYYEEICGETYRMH